TQMDEGTQQNAALVEEATAAARSMEQQAGQLVQTVAVFRVQDGGNAHSARAAVPTAPAPASVIPLARQKPAAGRAKPAARVPAARAARAVAEVAGDWQEF